VNNQPVSFADSGSGADATAASGANVTASGSAKTSLGMKGGMSSTTSGKVVPAAGGVTMYSTTWCGYCNNLTKQLGSLGIPVQKIDIEQNEAAALYVEQVGQGNRTVPVVVFPDGTVLTNPRAAEVKAQLAAGA
jgi:mycoredoxin